MDIPPETICELCSELIIPGTPAGRPGRAVHPRCLVRETRLELTARRHQLHGAFDRSVELVRRAQHLAESPSGGQDVARHHLAAIVRSSADAIVSKTLDGIVRTWNAAAERIFGYSAEEMIGQPIAIIIPADRSHEGPQILARIRAGERIDHFETVRRRKDGTLIDVSVTFAPIKDADGRIIAASKVARDISARKREELERAELLARERSARAEADAANRAKDEFLAMVSHEFRTPLNGITGWLHVLRSKRAEPAHVERALDSIQLNARLLTKLVDDLLDVSRIVAGRIVLEQSAVDVCPLVESVLTSLQPLATEKGVLLEATLDPWAGPVHADSGRLQQVFGNIVGNAIKFTPAGGRVDVLVQNEPAEVVIVVRDTGQGIPPEFLPQVFEAFRQAAPIHSRVHGGLGLGLAIVRHLVTAHGGTVSVESSGIGQGCCVTVRLPRSEPSLPSGRLR